MNDKLELIAAKKLTANEELYKLVDFLNKNLKNKNLMFGLTRPDETTMIISVYEI